MDEPDENDPRALQILPKDDPVQGVILQRIYDMERMLNGFDRWRVKAQIMLDGVEHLEARMEARVKATTEEQTARLLAELTAMKDDLKGVMTDRTFWANVRTFLGWCAAASVPIIAGIWTISAFVWDHLPGRGK